MPRERGSGSTGTPLAQPGALRHVVHRCQLGGGLLDQHREHQEGGRRDRPSSGGVLRTEHRAEHAGLLQQSQQRLRVAAQPRGIQRAPGAAPLTGLAAASATEASSLRSVSVRWLAYSRPAIKRSMTPR